MYKRIIGLDRLFRIINKKYTGENFLCLSKILSVKGNPGILEREVNVYHDKISSMARETLLERGVNLRPAKEAPLDSIILI